MLLNNCVFKKEHSIFLTRQNFYRLSIFYEFNIVEVMVQRARWNEFNVDLNSKYAFKTTTFIIRVYFQFYSINRIGSIWKALINAKKGYPSKNCCDSVFNFVNDCFYKQMISFIFGKN